MNEENEHLLCPLCDAILQREILTLEPTWNCPRCESIWSAEQLADEREYSRRDKHDPPPSMFL